MFDINKIAQICKDIRINTLKMGLTEFSKENNENIKNIWAFENGKANNIKYLFLYYNMCEDEQVRRDFAQKLFNTFG